MSDFEREVPRFRLVEILRGDDLPAIAARELGDSNRWPELVWVNSLVHPYVTDDPRLAGPTVLLSGALLKVPSPSGFTSTDATEKWQVFERDCVMREKLLQDNGAGDFEIVSGVPNLKQQLSHRVITPRGQARRNPDYGCLIYRLLGTVNGPTANMLGAEYVKSCLAADYRVARVDSATAEVAGEVLRIQARAQAVEGGAVDIRIGA